jgi:predicted ATPase/DNA-binding SARP family transcriptional activator
VLGGPRQVKLLAFLLLNANRAVSADEVIDAVWGVERDGAAKRLQMAVVRLRRALEPLDGPDRPRLRTVSGGYLLSVAPGELDAAMLDDQVRQARRALGEGEPAGASGLLTEALNMWRGPPLAEVAFEDFAQVEIHRLEELHLVALETRIEADLQLGRSAELIGELEGLAAENPTREALAGQLMLALYRAGRQADALETYQRTRTRLASELGLEPGPALKALQSAILEQSPSLGSPSTALHPALRPLAVVVESTARGVVPHPPTSTIGREQYIETVCRLLAGPETRLLTLTGPGGVGKTRLAIEVARALSGSFADGVSWVELAGVARSEDVGSTIARGLDVAPLPGETVHDALCRELAGKRILLVIDNFEHLLGAAVLVADLLAASSALTVLATSREALDLAAEHRFAVAPLTVPERSARTVSEIESTAGSALFLAAVRRRDARFAFGPDAASAIARICARLGGLPLALELAAARAHALGVEVLANRLEELVGDLGPGPRDAPVRHRTLRATIDWSYSLLELDQADAFVRFAVFAGGATIEAAQAVTGACTEALEALVAKSLIDRRVQPDRSVRLVMLETIREYASERLARDPQREAVDRRHLEHYLQVVEQAGALMSTSEEAHALAGLDVEIDNILTALRWAIRTQPADALRLAGHLGMYWWIRGDPESLTWLDTALDAAGAQSTPTDRARAQLWRTKLLLYRQEHDAARDAAYIALALFQQAGDHNGMAAALCELSGRASQAGEPDQQLSYAQAACREARLANDPALLGRAIARHAVCLPPAERVPALEEAATLLAQAGDHRELANSYINAAYTALLEDRVAEAMRLLHLARPATDRIDSPVSSMLIAGNIGLSGLFTGDLPGAREAFRDQLRLCQGHAFRYGADEGLIGLAAIAAREGQPERAARLLGAARALGYPPAGDQPIDDRLEQGYFAAARAAYGEVAWQHAQQLGATLSYDQAIAYALEPTTERPAQQAGTQNRTAAVGDPII